MGRYEGQPITVYSGDGVEGVWYVVKGRELWIAYAKEHLQPGPTEFQQVGFKWKHEATESHGVR